MLDANEQPRMIVRSAALAVSGQHASAGGPGGTHYAQAPPSRWAKYGFGAFVVLTLGLGLMPWGVSMLRNQRSRRARRGGRLFLPSCTQGGPRGVLNERTSLTRCIAWILIAVMTVGPERAYALHVEAQAQAAYAKAVTAAVLAGAPMLGAATWTDDYDQNGSLGAVASELVDDTRLRFRILPDGTPEGIELT